jgi:hypothetical protein
MHFQFQAARSPPHNPTEPHMNALSRAHAEFAAHFSDGAPMPSYRDDIAHDAARFRREYGTHIPMLGDDERSDALADDLRTISGADFLAGIPNPSDTRREDDLQYQMLSQPSGEVDANGKSIDVGTQLYGAGWADTKAPSNYELQRRHEEARRVVLDTAAMDAPARHAHRTLALARARFEAEHGHIDRATYDQIGAEIARAGVPYNLDNYNQLIAQALSHSGERTNPEVEAGSPPSGRNATHSGHPDEGRTIIPGHQRVAGPVKKGEEPADSASDMIADLHRQQQASGYY